MHKLMPWEWEKIGNRLMVQLTRHRGRLQKARHRKSQQQRDAAKLSAENMWVACPYLQHRKELLQIGVAPDAAPSSFRRTADNEVIHGQFVSTARDENTVTAVIDVPDTQSRLSTHLSMPEAVKILASMNVKLQQLPMDVEKQQSLRQVAQCRAAERMMKAADIKRAADTAELDAQAKKRAADLALVSAAKEKEKASKRIKLAELQLQQVQNVRAQNMKLSTQVAAAQLAAARIIKQKEAEVLRKEREIEIIRVRLENMRRLKNAACTRARNRLRNHQVAVGYTSSVLRRLRQLLRI